MNLRRLSLGERLSLEASRLRGAPEHTQIAQLLNDADTYRLTDQTTAALTDVLRHHTSTIEQNIDLIRPTNPVTWIEYCDIPRRHRETAPLAGAVHPVTVGALICVDNENPDRLVVVTGWDFADGTVRHSYAAASVSLNDMANLAWAARTRLSRNPEDSIQRLLDQATVFIPPGLAEEISVLEGIDHPEDPETAIAARHKAVTFDIASEMPFVLAALLAINSKATVVRQAEEGPAEVELRSIGIPILPWRRTPGFRRVGSKPSPGLDWLWPAA